MKRRDFLAAAGIAGTIPATSFANSITQGGSSQQEYYELRKYYLLNRSKTQVFHSFLRDAVLPALKRIGIGPVGVFNVKYGENVPLQTVYTLVPHRSLESCMAVTDRLAQDSEFMNKGYNAINASISDPAYVRFDSSLMLAFKDIPKMELPKKKAGIFELRTYESHSTKAAKKKIEMFNEGGEIQIFRDTGLSPVFFGETLAGPQMPNLIYMLAFEDMAERDKNWSVFVDSPGWKSLSADPQYKDTVSNITDVILTPTPYSQI